MRVNAPDVQCELCPKGCVIAPGQSGDCRARVNLDGKLIASTYGRPCAVHVDPIEKKPLFHFLPTTKAFSIATAGCNLHCRNCQNWQISQSFAYDQAAYDLPPDKLVAAALNANCASIAYTYTDPVVFYEYTRDSCVIAHERGVRNVLVTAGYINPGPMRELCKVADAANVDLKYFDDALYRSNSDGALKPVLDALVIAKEEGVWLEVTNLLIPTISDDTVMIRKMCEWMVANLGADTPIHFSRFHPQYKLRELPVTPDATLDRARTVALDAGLRHVFIGNRPGQSGEATVCPNDGELLIRRAGYLIMENRLEEGCCPKCGTAIAGVWE